MYQKNTCGTVLAADHSPREAVVRKGLLDTFFPETTQVFTGNTGALYWMLNYVRNAGHTTEKFMPWRNSRR